MLKKELRKLYKEKRAKLSLKDLDEKSIAIANKALELPIWDYIYYHVFLSIATQNEIQTEYLLHILHAKDKEIVVPKSNFNDASMVHYLLTDNTLIKKNAYGIPEPVTGLEVPETTLEVIFIPLLAFDLKGNRVGYGKGFYDAFLAKVNPNTIKIGLSFFEAEPAISDVHASDIGLDYCITPDKIYRF